MLEDEKKLLQLLCSNDSKNVLLALHFFEEWEEIPVYLHIAIGLCYFMDEEAVAEQSKFLSSHELEKKNLYN